MNTIAIEDIAGIVRRVSLFRPEAPVVILGDNREEICALLAEFSPHDLSEMTGEIATEFCKLPTMPLVYAYAHRILTSDQLVLFVGSRVDFVRTIRGSVTNRCIVFHV